MPKHVLIVGEQADTEEATDYLVGEGYRLTAVESASAARQVVATDPPDLVISDLQLEDSDGLTLVAALRAAHPSIPVILLTGTFFNPEVVDENGSRKINAYLQKSAPLARLLEVVRRLIGG